MKINNLEREYYLDGFHGHQSTVITIIVIVAMIDIINL